MSSRKCIFSNKDSNSKKSIIPRDRSDGEIHNWTLYSPTNLSYDKENRMPNDLEMEMHETFYMLELAKLKVKYLEEKMKDLQNKNLKKQDSNKKSSKKKKSGKSQKEKEIEMAFHEKDVIQNTDVDEVLEERKNNKTIWD